MGQIITDLSTVYHVGFLNPACPIRYQPAGYSFEGNGLSVSTYPEEWMKIAKLGGGSKFRLSKDSPLFLNAHDRVNQASALKWALDAEMIKKIEAFRVSYFDDEYGEELCSDYLTLEEAQQEAPEDENISKIEGYQVTDHMMPYFKTGISPGLVMSKDYALIWYAEAAGLDGVWWNDEYAPELLSAPRGVIFQNKLDEWKIEPA